MLADALTKDSVNTINAEWLKVYFYQIVQKGNFVEAGTNKIQPADGLLSLQAVSADVKSVR